MRHSDTITNSISGKTCTTTVGTCKTPYVIYAAECTFHNKLYIGHTSQPLNMCFNGHSYILLLTPSDLDLSLSSSACFCHFASLDTCGADTIRLVMADLSTCPLFFFSLYL